MRIVTSERIVFVLVESAGTRTYLEMLSGTVQP